MNTLLLPRYVIRSAFFAMIIAVLGLWLLQSVFSYLAELEDISDTYTLVDALQYIAYRSPYFLVQFLPTGTLLGAVIGLGLLANHSELIVMRAAGLSLYRIIGWVMIPALVFVAIFLGINQFILPTSSQYARAIKDDRPKNQLVAIDGYWSVTKQDDRQEVVYISYADSQGRLGGVKKYELQGADLTLALQAQGGVHQSDRNRQELYFWQLHGINQLNIDSQGVKQSYVDHKSLALPIAPQAVHLLTREPEDLSLTDLYAHAKLMKHQGSRSYRHELAFWQKLFSPFSVLSLVLVASSFVFGSLRSQGLGFRVVLALLTGLLFSYLTDLMGFIALATNFSPLLMALLPILISAMAGWYLLQKKSQ